MHVSRQIGHISVRKEHRHMGMNQRVITVTIIINSIIIMIFIIKSAFIYHLCFVVLSILHHRDNDRRIEKGGGRRTKK